MNKEKIRILYIDDEIHNLNTFKANFRRDYEIFACESCEKGREILKEKDIEMIITDQRMPVVTGVQFLESIVTEYPDPVRIILTGYSDLELVIDSINKGRVHYYLTKPWEAEELRLYIEKAYEFYSLKKRNKKLIEDLKEVNFKIEAMLRKTSLDQNQAPS